MAVTWVSWAPDTGTNIGIYSAAKLGALTKTTKDYDLLVHLLRRHCTAPVKVYRTAGEMDWATGVPSVPISYIDVGDTMPVASLVQPPEVRGTYKPAYIATPWGYDEFAQEMDRGNNRKNYDEVDNIMHNVAWAKRRFMASEIWSGSGTGKAMLGLTNMIPKVARASQTGTLFGLARATYDFLRSQYYEMTGYNFGQVPPGQRRVAGLIAIDELIKRCTWGARKPSHIITTQNIFLNIRRALEELTIYNAELSDKIMLSLGFDSFDYNGIKICWDPRCGVDTLYALHLSMHDRGVEIFGKEGNNYQKVDMTYYDGPDKCPRDIVDEPTFMQCINPNFVNKIKGPLSSLASSRRFNVMGWSIDSYAFFPTIPKLNGVLGSDTGLRLETW